MNVRGLLRDLDKRAGANNRRRAKKFRRCTARQAGSRKRLMLWRCARFSCSGFASLYDRILTRHQFFYFFRLLRNFGCQHTIAVFRDKHVVFDANADAQVFFGNILRVRRDVEAGFDGDNDAGFQFARLVADAVVAAFRLAGISTRWGANLKAFARLLRIHPRHECAGSSPRFG